MDMISFRVKSNLYDKPTQSTNGWTCHNSINLSSSNQCKMNMELLITYYCYSIKFKMKIHNSLETQTLNASIWQYLFIKMFMNHCKVWRKLIQGDSSHGYALGSTSIE